MINSLMLGRTRSVNEKENVCRVLQESQREGDY
jgi:hypothetical protein